ncbi:M28 family peptidase [Bacteroidota bacterium]
MKRFFLPLFLIISVNLILAQKGDSNPQITAYEILGHITFLASDDLEGRMTGSPGCYTAGDYIKSEFQSYGLQPLFEGSFFQLFPFIEGVEITEANRLSVTVNGESTELKLYEDFTTASFSGNKEISAGLVFAGYGLTVPPMQYDDYADINVTGKIVVVMNYHPEYNSTESMFDKFSSLRQKAANARDKGAEGIIFVNGHHPDFGDELMKPDYDGASGMQDFAVMQVKRNIIDELFKKEGADFAGHQKKIDETKKPASFTFQNTSAEIKTEINYIEKTARNVGGWIEGNDPLLKDEFIVIGAHYDHIGWGKKNSRYGGSDLQIHNGADDNASGTTGVLELAEKFASVKDQLKKSIIFLAFTGEEMGVLGSAYFVNNSPVDLANIVAMLNMDMIGRVDEENNLTIIGTGTSSRWENIINEKNQYGFNLSLTQDGFGGSDHLSFTQKGIPVLFFFTGIHDDYHMPGDDVDKINSSGEEKVVNLVFDIAESVDKLTDRPDFVKVERKAMPSRGRSKIKTGTIPEFSYQGTGYKISGTTDGSPAAKAGLLEGDIIIKFAGKQVDSIYDFMSAMSGISMGDTVEVVVLRGDEEITIMMELTAE